MVDNIAFLTQATAGVQVEFASPRGAELFVEDPGNAFLYLGENVSNTSDHIQVVISSSAVPEPESLALLETGALGLVGMIQRKLSFSKFVPHTITPAAYQRCRRNYVGYLV
jgi:hypothetical protein